VQEILYFEQGDGEIFIWADPQASQLKMVTCIDITSLYKEKRGKALAIIKFLCQVQHKNITYIHEYKVIDEKLIYIEMEAPS
jgi:hypothetical protein